MKIRSSILSVLFVAILTGCSGRSASNAPVMDHSKMANGDHASMNSSPGAAEAPYDLQFIDTMIAHHQGAIDMARLAGSRTQHDELRKLAAGIITSQQEEIEKMQNWRSKWFSGSAAAVNMELPGMSEGMSGMDTAKLDPLKANAFDQEFIRQMIPHHEGAVAMANDALTKSTKPEIKSLARQIVEAQDSEISTMKQWQESWK